MIKVTMRLSRIFMVSLGSSDCIISPPHLDYLDDKFDDSNDEPNVEILSMSYKTLYLKWSEDAQVLEQNKEMIEHMLENNNKLLYVIFVI